MIMKPFVLARASMMPCQGAFIVLLGRWSSGGGGRGSKRPCFRLFFYDNNNICSSFGVVINVNLVDSFGAC